MILLNLNVVICDPHFIISIINADSTCVYKKYVQIHVKMLHKKELRDYNIHRMKQTGCNVRTGKEGLLCQVLTNIRIKWEKIF